jgi:prepilin signal peptidase PulO-like enzyme (type II secretory pathway)
MTIIAAIFLFIVGAACGSFVGAMTWRMKKKLDWVKGRSICEHCKHQLSGLDLIPILSWLFLRGKCRYCSKKIGWLTLGLEIGIGAAFVLSCLLWPRIFGLANFEQLGTLQTIGFALWLIEVVLMSALLVYDARWRLLPNKLLFPLIGVAAVQVAVSFISLAMQGWLVAWDYLVNVALALIPVFGVYLALYLASRGKWIGFGDVKFGITVALMVADWRLALIVLIGANLLGTLATLPLLITRQRTMSSKIAFGPFLIVATFLVFLFSADLTRLIENFLLVLR